MNIDQMIEEFTAGVHYQGDFITSDEGRKIPHGEGIYRFANGDVFQGTYRHGQRIAGTVTNARSSRVWEGNIFHRDDHYPQHGTIIRFKKGRSEYDGAMQQGQPHGLGHKRWFDIHNTCKARYSGEWDRGYFCNGSYTYPDGTVYTGRWKDRKPHDSSSKALFKYFDGSRYEGPVAAGARHGKGRLVWLEHGKTTTLRATFDQDNASGDARISWLGGDQSFIGPLDARHQPAGPGTYTFLSENKVYIGESADRQPHGQGKMAWLNTGCEYNGQWQAGKQYGWGTFDAPKHRYSGPWSDDAMHCGLGETGLYQWHDGGFKCEGRFVDGSFPTEGTFTYPDERTYQGRLTTCGFPASDPQGIGQAPMPVPLDTSEVDRKRAHLRSTLDALVSQNGNTVVTAVRLGCGHELDLSEVVRLALDEKLAISRVEKYELQNKWALAKRLRDSAELRYRCPCCREPITKEPKELTPATKIQDFLNRVEKDFGRDREDCKYDAEFSKKYDALVKDFKKFPTINNGRPA